MTEETLDRRKYLSLLLLAALLGLGGATITFAFIELVHFGHVLLWEQLGHASGLSAPIFTVLICSIGGLLVGLLVRVFGDHSGIFAELMADFGRTGRFEYRHAPGIVGTALVSLVAGGSLGPEAPMADACGGLGTLVADGLKSDERTTRSLSFSGLSGMLAGFITSPFGGALLGMESAHAGISLPWTMFPSLVASAVGTTVFVVLSGTFFGSLYVFPEYSPSGRDLLLAVPLGLLGAVAGALFITTFHWLKRVMLPLKGHLVIRGLLGGLGLGLAGAFMPLVLFSGEEQTAVLINDAATIGVATLIALALVKLLITCLCLATGWKGGYIFPTMFAGVALGLAAHLIFPGIPVAVAVAATMGGAMVSTMKAPIFSALFVMLMVQPEASPAIAISVIVGLLATARLSMTSPPGGAPAA